MADQVRADIRARRTTPDDSKEFENDPRFLKRIEAARESLRLGRGVRIEDVEEQETYTDTRRQKKVDTKQKADIEKVILQMLDEYFVAVGRRDVKGFMSFFVDTEDMTVIEDQEIRPSRKVFEEFVVGFFKELTKVDATWEERRVFPLSLEVAVVTGIFRVSAQMTSGDTVGIRNAFTFVFVKQGDRWQIKHVHESSMPA